MALPTIVPFPYEIDWTTGFSEEREYETPIQESWDGTEQRSSLTDSPNRRFAFTIKALERESDEYQRLHAAIRGGQALRWWVPYWPRERRPTGPVTLGATSVSVGSTTHLGYVVGQGLLFYRSPARYEVVVVTAINATDIEVTATTMAWTVRDKVIPCFRALMAPEVQLIDHDVDLGQVEVTFDLEQHEDA